MFIARFPAAVTTNHHNPVVRQLASDINRFERRIYRTADDIAQQPKQIKRMISDGTDAPEWYHSISHLSMDLIRLMAKRSQAYDTLAEAIGADNQELSYLEFLAQYPPLTDTEKS